MGKHHYPNRASSSSPFVSRTVRKYLYNLGLALLPLLAAMGIVADEMIPLVSAVLVAFLGLTAARTHLTPEELEE